MTKPDREDYEAIEKQYGPLPFNASDKETAERYRLAVARKLIREHGFVPDDRPPEAA
jgi:hypothetical protein